MRANSRPGRTWFASRALFARAARQEARRGSLGALPCRIAGVAWIVIVAAGLTGCDPGWDYRLRPEGADSSRLDTLRVERSASARLFSSRLRARIFVTNLGPTPLTIQPGFVVAFDVRGRGLTVDRCECDGVESPGIVVLEANKTARLDVDLIVRPMSPLLVVRNGDLRLVSIILDGLIREGRFMSLRCDLEWNQ